MRVQIKIKLNDKLKNFLTVSTGLEVLFHGSLHKLEISSIDFNVTVVGVPHAQT